MAIGDPWSTLECIALRMAGVADIEWRAANELLAVN